MKVKFKDIPSQKLLSVIIACKGNMNKAADYFDMTFQQFMKLLDDRPEVQQKLHLSFQGLFNKAVESAEFLLDVHDATMTKFVLEKIGPSNGFGKENKLIISGDPENPILTQSKIDLNQLSEEELLKLKEITSKVSGMEED